MSPQNDHVIDRRKQVAIREWLSPILVSIVIGIGSSFLTTYISVNTLQLKVQYLEKSVDGLLSIVKDMNRNEIKMNSFELNMDEQSRRMTRIEERLQKLEDRK